MHQQKPLTKPRMILDFLQGAKLCFVLGALFACLSSLLEMEIGRAHV